MYVERLPTTTQWHSKKIAKHHGFGDERGKWRLLEVEYLDPHMNMAVEEAILLAVEKGEAPNTVRFWRNANAVVLGCSNRVEYEVNLTACRKYNTTIVRRITGGGTVYQDYGNLNWSITLRRNATPLPNDLLGVYEKFGNIIVKGMRALVADVSFKPFNAIVINGKKICGMAMYSKKNSILCHGTLLVNSELEILSEVLNVPKKQQQSRAAKVTTLERELNTSLPLSEVKKSIIASVQKLQDIQLEKCPFVEENLSETLYWEKYSRTEWNYGSIS